MDHEESEVKADDAEIRDERKIESVHTWMIFIRPTGVEKGRKDGGSRGREDFSISICHSFFMRFLSLLILEFFFHALLLTVVWVQARPAFITFVNR